MSNPSPMIRILTGPTIPIRLQSVQFTGSYQAAAFLEACIYWTNWAADEEGRDSFWKTHASWKEDLALSRDQIDQARSLLEPHGIVKSWNAKAANGKVVTHYQVDWKKLERAVATFKKTRKPLKRLISLKDWYRNAEKQQSVNGVAVAENQQSVNGVAVAENQQGEAVAGNPQWGGETVAGNPQFSPYTTLITKDKEHSQDARAQDFEPESVSVVSPEALEPEPEPELINPEILEPDRPVQRQPIQTSVAKKNTPVGPEVPPAAPQQSATILPFNANSAANFETRWTLSQKPYILQTSPLKFHPAIEAAVVMAFGDLYRMANGQANLVKIRSFLRNRSGSVEGLQALDDLWEQAERTASGETTPLDHLAAKATPAKQSSRDEFWESIQL